MIESTFVIFRQKYFFEFQGSLVRPRFVYGSSLVFDTEHIYKVQGKGILTKSTFSWKPPNGIRGNQQRKIEEKKKDSKNKLH